MFEWIGHNRELFLVNYTDIGTGYNVAEELQNEHSQFTMNSMVRSPLLYFVCLNWIESLYLEYLDFSSGDKS